ncbi:related to cytochrome P450 monooxygenase (lovA) [Rhynchosporium agropyri]|uniref:Related to cytochrome P450 monooxygenase (LovA) n=1 Tax=Rhynchosporium agropyri TaxID=914238 RepID=A0A1E1K9M9_9HELO|nr:related to cytochrome P450 monooxygenase (lovA) [Rhynchosporium agropyri]
MSHYTIKHLEGISAITFRSPLILGAAGLLLVASFIRFLLSRPKKLDLPIVEVPGSSDQREALLQGTAQYPDSPFIIKSEWPIVILPVSVINEVKSLPESKVSFTLETKQLLAYEHTGVGDDAHEVLQAIKIDLTRNLASTLDDMQEEIKARAAELLRPILEQQLAKEKNEKIRRDDVAGGQGIMISWMLKHTPEHQRASALVLVKNQMSLSFASIDTTASAIVAAIYDLATYPEYIQPLRDEIQQVMDEDGCDIDADGIMRFKKASIPKLWKLDSFMKESQRHTPSMISTANRITTSALTLSTGHTLPKGTRFGFPAWVVHRSPNTPVFNPAKNPSSKLVTEFDGLRFYNYRKIPGNENKQQFVTASPESLNFGQGTHACPGRFFASNEIKVVLIELLKNWDIRFVGDYAGTGGIERRPKNVLHDLLVVSDAEAELEFRRRKR